MDVTSLSAALEQARLKYHAQTVRSKNFYINFSKKLENYDHNCLGVWNKNGSHYIGKVFGKSKLNIFPRNNGNVYFIDLYRKIFEAPLRHSN